MNIDRSGFLYTLGAGAFMPRRAPLARGLVLSGGGAKGAYEAGVIAALAAQTPDGTRLPQYNGVAGTSIGCLNGWFLATGQYTKMRELWMNVAQERVFRLKPEFAKIGERNAGVIDRLYQLMHLGLGVRDNVEGLCQSQPALHWIQRYVDPSRPALMPFAWAVTNITRQTPEYFYRLPPGVSASTRNAVLAEFTRTLNRDTVVREASDDVLHRAIFASACLPVIFDPIELPAPDGNGTNQYCDGGLTANTPLSFARVVARNVDVILLSPPYSPLAYQNALDIGFAAFDTMQRYILYAAMRSAWVENTMARRNPTDTGIAFLRPTRALPVNTTAFNDQRRITEAYEMGRNDAKNGFTVYTPNAL